MTQRFDPDPDTLPAEELRVVSDAIRREFPLGETRRGVVLMDVDPYHLHAYWQIDPARLEGARAAFGGSDTTYLVLRFRQLQAPEAPGTSALRAALESFDREVNGPRGQVEVSLWGRGGTWEAELGLTALDGGWMSLAQSNRVRMAPAGPARMTSYAVVNLANLVRAAGPQPAAQQSPQTGRADLPAPLGDRLPETEAGRPGKPVPGEVESALFDPSLRGGGPDELEPEFPNPLADSAPAATGEPPVGRIPAQVPPRRPPVEAVPQRVPLPASSASWSATSDLELYAELYVYGHARPGSELNLFGRHIELEPDGGFRQRFPLRADDLLLGSLAYLDDDTMDGID
jgi:hypothetical protein